MLKNRVTNLLLANEKRSLYRFLILYIVMMIGIISLISIYYYQYQKQLMMLNKRVILSDYASEQARKIKSLHFLFPEQNIYPRDSRFVSAIYDLEYQKIFSLLKSNEINFDRELYITKDKKIHFIKSFDDYYLGAKYLILEIDDDELWLHNTWQNIIIYGGFAIFIFSIIGFFLLNLFLSPMKTSLNIMDRFIKYTTHELNTPLSAILTNIEMMDLDAINEDNRKKINRINIAAKTVSVLYNDLTYITLENDIYKSNEKINLKNIIEERVEYFDILARSKEISFTLDLNDSFLVVNKNKFTRVIDNLISNAIKYNKRKGHINIKLFENSFTVEDLGIGIEPDKIRYIFDRYSRFNSSEGGFGIGLSIVKNIIDEYGMQIVVKSKINEGTSITITW
ncbi:MAG: histidine kinase [Sulfurovum sp. AS07-7]|nr:MAG: histidine kinase [Sulfurovum sp. AS07-7]